MENMHRLFVNLRVRGAAGKNKLVNHDMRWAYSMDMAIATAVLAMSYGLEKSVIESLYVKFHRLLPKNKEPEYLEPAVLVSYCQHALPVDKRLSAHDICDFILALSHRSYAFKYESERWLASKFKAIPVGLPRTRNCTPVARNYTPHTFSMYQGYREQLRMGKVFEVPAIFDLCNNLWVRRVSTEAPIELTETRSDNWLHTRLSNLPLIWKHIDDLFNLCVELKSERNTAVKLKTVLGIAAQVHWWMSHGMPYRRGSAAVADMLSKAMLQYHNVSTPCWKVGIAPDLEAFCRTLDDYIEKYNLFFTKRPSFN
ncbi:hypothetical protein [Desulfogranum marinum]|uniref:hypothetical protein n=1 Tax=Desulfogranum marinum TaxID=453220 RepID=UPI0029C8505D|nr:hypothetical protein [Desulfogranum marinum]